MEKTDIFISYSHQDEAWKKRLKVALDVQKHYGCFSVWEDSQIDMGVDWGPEIECAIASARVFILLVSKNFLASDFIQEKELPRILERRQIEGLKVKVIPVLLESCSWEITPLKAIQGGTRGNKPLNEMPEAEQDRQITNLVNTVHRFLSQEEPDPKPNPKSYIFIAILAGIALGYGYFTWYLKPDVPGVGRFVDNGDGTVTDRRTGLMWKQCSEGQDFDPKAHKSDLGKFSCPGLAKSSTLEEAYQKFIGKTKFAGYSDWRLPNNDELRTLIWCSNDTKINKEHLKCGEKSDKYDKPTIFQRFFPNTGSDYYISTTSTKKRTPRGKNKNWYFITDFGTGGRASTYSLDMKGKVRLVRKVNRN